MNLQTLTCDAPVTRAEVLEASDTLAAMLGRDAFASGSALLYDSGHDADVVVQAESGDDEVLRRSGWEYCAGACYPDSKMIAMRKGRVNAILVYSEVLWEQWATATLAALKLQDVGIVLNKAQRVALFESIRCDAPADALDDRLEFVRGE